MDEEQWVTEQFEGNRARLLGMAYRMLGSRAEAEDAVQEAWLRILRGDATAIENVAGWLTTVTSRVCLDRLRSRATHREDPSGDDVPDVQEAAPELDPPEAAVLAESIGAALLVVLDSMTPEERVAFVLHDVFAVPFDTIGGVVGRSPQAARQLASRARRRVQGSPIPTTADFDRGHHRELVEAFIRAARHGDFETLLRILHPDVVLEPDDAALRMGSRPPMRGAREVASALSGGARSARVVLVDGMAAMAWAPGGKIRSVVRFTVEDQRITALTVIADAERLEALDIGPLGS